jgi:ABC-type antimicrobial peptide transport system permease subunit
MKLVQTQYLGYNKNQILHFANTGMRSSMQQAFTAAASALPGVDGVSNMEGDLLGNHGGGGRIDWPGKSQPIEFSGLYADFDFTETLGLRLLEGRTFNKENASDTAGILFNETAVKMMELSNPIGKTVRFWGKPTKIIGVLKDFHFESLYNTVGPLFLSYRRNTANLIVRVTPGSESEVVSALGKLYQRYNPGVQFDYRFLDQDFQKLYAAEHHVAVLSRYFATLAILICCLGLIGLSAITAERKFKEIGIRKVLGATEWNVLYHLLKDILKPVLASLFFAMPIAFLLCQNWLASFAYRIDLQWWFFASAGVAALLISLVTIAFQGYEAVRTSPLVSLKSE